MATSSSSSSSCSSCSSCSSAEEEQQEEEEQEEELMTILAGTPLAASVVVSWSLDELSADEEWSRVFLAAGLSTLLVSSPPVSSLHNTSTTLAVSACGGCSPSSTSETSQSDTVRHGGESLAEAKMKPLACSVSLESLSSSSLEVRS